MELGSLLTRILAVFLIYLGFAHTTVLASNLADYGRLPTNRSMSISPDGSLVAWIREANGTTNLVVVDVQTLKPVRVVNVGDGAKLRSLQFGSNRYIITRFSETTRVHSYVGRFENSAAYAIDIKTGETVLLLDKTPGLYPAQASLGNVIAVNSKEEVAYMAAYDDSSNARYNIYRVNLRNGKGKLHKKGNASTFAWHMNKNGEVLAREDFDDKNNIYTVNAYTSGNNTKEIYRHETDIVSLDIVGISANNNELYILSHDDNFIEALSILPLKDGVEKDPIFQTSNSNITQIITFKNELVGVRYSGVRPSYQFLSEHTQAAMDRVIATFPEQSVFLLDIDESGNTFVLSVSGSNSPDDLYLFDTQNIKLKKLGSRYESISANSVADVSSFAYKAQDGTELNAIATWPLGSSPEDRKNLPTLIFPHGGPASYSSIQFDWWAQYFASLGYLVIEPNFRGSSGFGRAFTEAGRGKWGKEMQTDVTDAFDYLVGLNIANPNKTCIMGASYGGYVALLAGGITPDKFSCVIAVNGVTDLPKMLTQERRESGSDSWVLDYWRGIIGDNEFNKVDFENISPITHAKAFKAPTLIIYSKDDTVVSPTQSRDMISKLKSADKNIHSAVLSGEDHWLSVSDTRQQMLTEIDGFLKTYNPIN